MAEWLAKGQTATKLRPECAETLGRAFTASSTVPGGPEVPPGEGALWEWVRDGRRSGLYGGEREDPFQSYGLSRNLSKSVRATSLPEDVLPGMQSLRSLSAMFPAPSPPLWLQDFRIMLYFIQFGSRLVPFILLFIHLTQCDPARGKILIDNAWKGNGRK